MTVGLLIKYLVNKLGLGSESEVSTTLIHDLILMFSINIIRVIKL